MSESTIVFILSLIAMTGSITGNIFIIQGYKKWSKNNNKGEEV